MSASTGTRWSSTFAFLMVATGTAVGLGNIWRFPFLLGGNGGSAFLIIYLAAVAIIGLPIMLAELAIGRKGDASGALAVERLGAEAGASPLWPKLIGWLCFIVPFVGIGYYSVVGGWVSDYFAGAVVGHKEGVAPAGLFDAMLADPVRLLIGQSLFLGAVTYVVSFNIQSGIERVAKLMMPAFFVLLVALAVYAAFVGDFGRALQFLFQPDFSAVTMKTVMLAVGQAFFSIAIGLGIMITFGSYLPEETSLVKAALTICIADTAVSVIAGLAIFPLLFAQGLSADGGPGLIFVTMPGAFAAATGGALFNFLFFGFLFLATFTTGIGTLEAAVGWLINRGMARRRAAFLCGGGAWLVALVAMLSFNELSAVRPLAFIQGFADSSIFDTLDLVIANILLPVNGLLVALFAGWALKAELFKSDIGDVAGTRFFALWRFVLRFIVPLAIGAILVQAVAGR